MAYLPRHRPEMAPEPNKAKSFSSEPSQCLCSFDASRTALCDWEFNRAEPAARSQNLANARGRSRTCTRSRKGQEEPILNMISVFKLRLELLMKLWNLRMFLRNGGNVGGMTARQGGLEISVEHNECRDIWIIRIE